MSDIETMREDVERERYERSLTHEDDEEETEQKNCHFEGEI